MTTPNMPAPDGAYQLSTGGGPYRYGKDHTESTVRALTRGATVPKMQAAQDAFRENYRDPINEHTRTIGEIRAEMEQMTIHGLARVLTGDGFYYASPGTISVDLVMIGAGGAGGVGSWNAIAGSRGGGSGGGGGGENHFTIYGTGLFNTDGTPRAIPYACGAPSTGGQTNEQGGQGGGNTTFDGISVYGGGGGRAGGGDGVGGYGIVPGGSASPDAEVGARDSLSAFGLYGGGGAGGRGGSGGSSAGEIGGRGGLNAGGAGGLAGAQGGDAPPVSKSAPTGGGGGGGGGTQGAGGHGAFPGGGGGGSGGAGSAAAQKPGGNGAQGVIYVIERGV